MPYNKTVAAIKELLLRSVTHQDPEEVEPACRDTLKKLKLDYLDLYLVS